MRISRSVLWLLGVLFAALASAALAADPPKSPVLEIEAGVHTTTIEGYAVDNDGRWLVTASGDKTARIWDLATGTLLRTLRPPIGADSEGKMFCAAFAPDGAQVAVAGATGAQWNKTFSVYIFDRASGDLKITVPGLAAAPLALAWSRDGTLLAVGLAGNLGLRVFRTADWRQVGEDTGYAASIRGLDFADDGRVAVSGEDGSIRVYRATEMSLQRVAAATLPAVARPWRVRFSPDGKRLAVGNGQNSDVAVLSGDTLDTLYMPARSTSSPDRLSGSLLAVEWSRDGQTLFAAGGLSRALAGDRPNTILRRWGAGGTTPPRDEFVTTNTIFGLLSLRDGRVLFFSAVPSWGTFNPADGSVRATSPATLDFRDPTALLLADGGRTVIYNGILPGLKDATSLALKLGERTLESPTLATGAAPRTTGTAIKVGNWRLARDTTLGGAPLPLAKDELSRSLAIERDEGGFILGTEWNLRRFDATGKVVWRVSAPASFRAVNITEDQKLVVALVHDGTIRWYRYADGAPVLAVFVHADRKRWVAWTRSGYYDASPGAEDLIGWSLNRGAGDAADFFPASRFRDKLYRPDVVERILDTLNEGDALKRANEAAGRKEAPAAVLVENALPPVVNVVSPAQGSGVATAKVAVKANVRFADNAPLQAMRVRVNGQAVAATASVTDWTKVRSGETVEFSVPVPAQDAEIAVFGENRNGVSAAATVRVAWKGGTALDEASKPKLYVLAVGISNYDNPDYKLAYPAKDAKDFATALLAQKGQLYRDVEVKLLTDKSADRDGILDGLDWLQRQVTQRDVGMLYLAGHGINSNDGVYYFAPSNFDLDRSRRTGVVFEEIKRTLVGLPGKAIFFIDTCHSGNILGGRRGLPDMAGVVNELSSAENGVVVFSSSTGREYSLEAAEWNNGAFTKALVEGIGGKADIGKTGRVTHKMLDIYVSERVKELTAGKQHPVTQAPGGVPDFPLASTLAR